MDEQLQVKTIGRFTGNQDVKIGLFNKNTQRNKSAFNLKILTEKNMDILALIETSAYRDNAPHLSAQANEYLGQGSNKASHYMEPTDKRRTKLVGVQLIESQLSLERADDQNATVI